MKIHKNKADFYKLCIYITVLVIAITLAIVFSFNDKTIVVTITDKERIVTTTSESVSSKYLVFGDNNVGKPVVFENTDNIFRWKWNSSNIQGQLKEGKTYKLTVVGYRIPILSQYENIIKVEEIK